MTVGNVEFSRHSAFGREKCQLRPCSWLGLGRFYLQLIAAWFSDCNGHVWQRLMHRPRRQLFITEPHYWTLLIRSLHWCRFIIHSHPPHCWELMTTRCHSAPMHRHSKISLLSFTFVCPAPRVGGIKRWCASDVWLTDVWRLSVAYVGPKSRTERLRKAQR